MARNTGGGPYFAPLPLDKQKNMSPCGVGGFVGRRSGGFVCCFGRCGGFVGLTFDSRLVLVNAAVSSPSFRSSAPGFGSPCGD